MLERTITSTDMDNKHLLLVPCTSLQIPEGSSFRTREPEKQSQQEIITVADIDKVVYFLSQSFVLPRNV